MTSVKNSLEEGDVITSPEFAYGSYDPYDCEEKAGEFKLKKRYILIDERHEKNIKYKVTIVISEEDRVEMAARNGKIPPKEIKVVVNLSAYDVSRAKANFVVERSEDLGYSSGHGGYDYYYDGWLVEARRLNEDDSYNPDGELIRFYLDFGGVLWAKYASNSRPKYGIKIKKIKKQKSFK